MPSAIAKANKNFLCYYLARVLRMLYKNADCDHVEGLQTIMKSCDASILDDIPDKIGKLSGHIFLCYCLARVLRMLYKNVDCDHVEGLQTIMKSCDASILDYIPDKIGKLSGRIIRKWWASHGLPYVTELFHVTPKVRMFYNCYDVCVQCWY
jgi:hypothetical protein